MHCSTWCLCGFEYKRWVGGRTPTQEEEKAALAGFNPDFTHFIAHTAPILHPYCTYKLFGVASIVNSAVT